VPILETHAPHQLVHTWRDFLIHIATIVVGLLIAVALEQTIEALHHRNQRSKLEQQMRAVFETDTKIDEEDFRKLARFRAYLAELRAAIQARLGGQSSTAAPAADDPRMAILIIYPSLAPYEAAKENGTVALLPTDRLRLYSRISYARDLTGASRDRWYIGLTALGSFRERYVDSAGSLGIGEIAKSPELETLPPMELAEYARIVSASIKETDLVRARLRIFDIECRAILAGARNEFDLIEKISRANAE
jgi:type II secretory pathway pseudopilin PulG